MKEYFKALKLVLFNATVVAYFGCVLTWSIVSWRAIPCGDNDVPTTKQIVIILLLYVIVEEICFYYIHRYYTLVL